MSLVCLLGDTHWGARGNSPVFHSYFMKSNDYMFGELRKRGVTDIWQFGDLFDVRKSINIQTFKWMEENFLSKFESGEFTLNVMLGNHDIYYKNTNDVNSVELLLKNRTNINIFNSMQKIKFDDGRSADIVPWVNVNQLESFYDFVDKSVSDYLFGHFEINGFAMSKHMKSKGGVSTTVFKHYKHVYSGHYHHASQKGNVSYLGTPYELTWEDYDDPKGFYIFDTKTGEIEFIKNPYSMYHKIIYNDATTVYDVSDIEEYRDSIVKLVVAEKNNNEMFESFVVGLESIVNDLHVTDNDMIIIEQDIDDIDVNDTLSVMMKSVDGVESEIDPEDIKILTKEIYHEAIEMSRSTA